MRTLILAVVAIALAGCASVPAGNTKLVYDHKANTYSVAAAPSQSEFVGTSAVRSPVTAAAALDGLRGKTLAFPPRERSQRL